MIKIQRPVPHVINQHFGENPAYYKQFGFAGHEGIDFLAPPGYPLKHFEDGSVKLAVENSGPYGTHIRIISIIDGYEVEFIYAHLSKVYVRTGQKVTAGQMIALTGSSGNVTGPHLHFTLKVKGMKTAGYPDGVVDPEKYLVESQGASSEDEGTGSVVVVQTPAGAAKIFTGLKEKVLMVDVSRYDPDFDPRVMADYGVAAVVVKSTAGGGYVDPLCRRHCANVRAAGLLLGLYPWLDGTFDGKTQAEDAARLNDEIKPDFVMIDNEQEHADWDKFYFYRQGKITWAQVTKLPKKQVQRVTLDFGNRAQVLWGNDLPTWNYSNLGFIGVYLREIIPFLEERYKTVLAYYFRGSGTVKISWEKFMQQEFNRWHFPKLLPGMSEPIGLQGTGDRYILPGSTSKMDVIAWNGNLDGLLGHLKLKSMPKPAPVPFMKAQLKEDCSGLNVREKATKDSRSLRILFPWEVIRLDPDVVSGPWRKLWGEPGWIHGGYITAVE